MAKTPAPTPDMSPEVSLAPNAATSDPVGDFLKRRKKATINDVAALARVSKKTVSRVINNSPSVREETREQVNDIIARVGFRPDPQARGLAFRRAFLVGLIYDNPNPQYIVNIQAGALEALRGTGMELVVHPCLRANEAFLEDIRDFIELQRLAGIIVLPPIAEDRRLLALIEELGVPMIRLTARPGEDNDPPILTPQIISRDRQGCILSGEHLAELGHRRIGYISGNMAYPSAHERRAGYDEGLSRHGLAFAADLDETGDYSFESGLEAARRILKNPRRPTAIVCANDQMAAGAYHAAYEIGLSIPGDLTVIGFDDAEVATRIYPPLTTVRLPTRDMARVAAEVLLDPQSSRSNLANRSNLVFEATLLVRGSSGPAKA